MKYEIWPHGTNVCHLNWIVMSQISVERPRWLNSSNSSKFYQKPMVEPLIDVTKSQLPQSNYFTTRILVLKFVNKGVIFWGNPGFAFSYKNGGILVITFVNLEKKGVFFMSSVLPWTGGSLGLKVIVLPQKRGFILDWKVSVLSRKGVVLSWKFSVLQQKKRSFSNSRTRMDTIFSSEWGSQGPN